MYSGTLCSYYMAIPCVRCGALQDRNYVVDDPYGSCRGYGMIVTWNNYYYMRIEINGSALLERKLQAIFESENDEE